MKGAITIGVLALICSNCTAQYWKALGRGTFGPTEIQTLYGDSVSDRLLAGGTFMWIMNDNDTVLGMGQAAWNGSRWDSLANRIQPISGNIGTQQTFWFLRFQGQLYACGGFTFLTQDSLWNRYLARLNEGTERWEDLGCVNLSLSGIRTLVPKRHTTTLYATGYSTDHSDLCGFPESCVFRYDGTDFHIWEPFELIPEENDNYVGTIFDFQGMTYMTGLLADPVVPGQIVTFLRYNGTTWEHVPGWNTLSPIKDILIHNNTLYVAGAFRYATDGPGNLIARFDGQNWNDMGGGLTYPAGPMSSAVLDLEWFHDNLLVAGFFSHAGGISSGPIAKWNGHQWCTFPGDMQWTNDGDGRLSDMAIWRDSLYICGGINTIDGDTIRQVAQWIGGDAVGECSTVGIDETVGQRNDLTITPLPQPGQWTIHFPHTDQWTMEVYDALGHNVVEQKCSGNTMVIDLSSHASGMFLLRAAEAGGAVLDGKVVWP